LKLAKTRAALITQEEVEEEAVKRSAAGRNITKMMKMMPL